MQSTVMNGGWSPINPRASPETRMNIERIELREIRLPLREPFQTSVDLTTERRILLIQVFDQSGATGWGECTAPEEPSYCAEWIDGAWLVMQQHLIPLLWQERPLTAEAIFESLAPVRGHRMAKGGIETACWDLQAKLAGQPLWHLLGGTRAEIECGVSLGLRVTPERMVERVALELAAGYRRIKLKIKPGSDVAFVAAVRKEFPAIRLSVDANTAYSLNNLSTLQTLDEFNLLMIEQPLGDDDLLDHARLQTQLRTAVCLDESILSLAHARKAIESGACRIINIKLGRVGGHTEARRIQQHCLSQNIPVWCGGMLEAGIGRAHNIAMSSLPGFSLPGDVSASQRYWCEDIIEPEVTVTALGMIELPTGAGIGYQVKDGLIERLTVRREIFTA